MDWCKLLNPNRLGQRPGKYEIGRSPFNADHDKVIFSGSFRRLARKTQVHPLAVNDHVHNRLTHSLEVACVGRSLGLRVGQELRQHLPPNIEPSDLGDIVQTACLAHDIGNPPFGHTGEEAIRHWFRNDGRRFLKDLSQAEACDLINFEGNAQGLRVLISNEYHTHDGGMRLTYGSLAAVIKYPWTALPAVSQQRPKNNKFGVFQSEIRAFHEIAEAVGLIACDGADWFHRHPLVCLMEAADDFCYGLLDLEDGLEMGILEWEEVFAILRPVLAHENTDALYAELGRASDGRKPSLIRGRIISTCINSAANAFVRHEKGILNGEYAELLPLCDPAIGEYVNAAKRLARQKIFTHPRKVELEIGAYNIIATTLEVMCQAVQEFIERPDHLSFKSQRVMDLLNRNSFHPEIRSDNPPNSPMYLALMRVIDFVSGMTDHYATYMAKQINGG